MPNVLYVKKDENLEAFIVAVLKEHPNWEHSATSPNGDAYAVTFVEKKIPKLSPLQTNESLAMRQQPTQEQPPAQNARPASVSQDARVQSAPQESISGENEFALVAKKVFSNIAQEKITLAEKTMQEKIDEIFGKIEERNMFWSNSWNDFTRQLAAIDKQFTEFMTTLEALNQKIAIMEKSWEDERSKQNGEVASNLADHKKFAESFAKVVQYLREIPIPK